MDGEGSYDGGGSGPGVPRACDQCRARKIRCDKGSPCSNCRTSARNCSSTGLGQKPKEPRSRVLISSQYERKIDQIEQRLAGIENLLKGLAVGSSQQQQHQQQRVTRRPHPTAASEPRLSPKTTPRSEVSAEKPLTQTTSPSTPDVRDDNSTIFDHDEGEDAERFEGSSSLAAHTVFASQFLEDAVRQTPSMLPFSNSPFGMTPFDGSVPDANSYNSRMESALNSLRKMVDLQQRHKRQAAHRFGAPGGDTLGPGMRGGDLLSHKHSLRARSLRDLPLPPMALVVEKLRAMKHQPAPALLTILFAFTSIDNFTESCRRLYFSTEDPTLGLFIIVNAGLISLFVESKLNATDPAAEAQYHAAWETCSTNLEIAISNIPLIMPATLENCEALLLGASWAVDVSRPSLAWLLTTRGVHMIRALGLHQASSIIHDTPSQQADKTLLFWCAYMLDKGLSLRLGRSSILQDYDISLPSRIPHAYAEFPGKEHLDLWVRHARVQGQIYERLYSPGALSEPIWKRVATVQEIADELNSILSETFRLVEMLKNMGPGGDVTGGGGGGGTKGGRGGGAAAEAGAASSSSSSPSPSIKESNVKLKNYIQILKSDEVSLYSSLALTYRALPSPSSPYSQHQQQQQQTNHAVGAPGGSGNPINHPPPISRTFTNECVHNARVAIHEHLEAMDMMGDPVLRLAHLHWTILYAPFIPYIVIFCLVIETGDGGDLRRLQDFTTSLEVAGETSASVRRLHQLCQVLYGVAGLYVEAKVMSTLQQQQQVHGQTTPGVLDTGSGAGSTTATAATTTTTTIPPASSTNTPNPMMAFTAGAPGSQFDMYLSQLGFMPLGGVGGGLPGNGNGVGTTMDDTMNNDSLMQGSQNNNSNNSMDMGEEELDEETRAMMAQTAQLGDWFSGNRNMMGMLEEDLSGINALMS